MQAFDSPLIPAVYALIASIRDAVLSIPSEQIKPAFILETENITFATRHFAKRLTSMGLSMTAVAMERLATDIERGVMPLIQEQAGEVESRLRDELGIQKLHRIPSDRVRYYNNHEPLFGDLVTTAFPDSERDIAAAGRLYALGEPTASVMHLMRALEPVLFRVARKTFGGQGRQRGPGEKLGCGPGSYRKQLEESPAL